MAELLTAAQMRAIEQAAFESGRVKSLDLMERAGQEVVQAVTEEWPDMAEGRHRAVVFCGPGNNGGDGFVIARLLQGRGWDVTAYLYGDPLRLPPDARTNYRRWTERRPALAFAHFKDSAEPAPDLFVDAIFGIGLTRPVAADVAGVFKGIAEATPRAKMVAVDLPTGINSDTGAVMTEAPHPAKCDLTVTFHRPKHGHVAQDGPAYCGKTVVRDIGL